MNKDNQNVCEEANYKLIFKQFGEKLFQFLCYKFHNEDLARDAMQEAFVVLWENCKKVSFAQAKNYLFTVGKNKAIDTIRREKLHLSISEGDDYVEYEAFLDEEDEKLKNMKMILDKMPSSSREAFLMNRMNDMTYSEIAKSLEISVKAVEKRMSIALKVIREELISQKK